MLSGKPERITCQNFKVLRRDVEVAKNYLGEGELEILNRIVTAYPEIAELQAINQIPMTMQDWIERLHLFLTMAGHELLTDAGSISHETAIKKARIEYENYCMKKLNEPTEVEKHFIEMKEEIKQIEGKTGEKTPMISKGTKKGRREKNHKGCI